MESWHHLEHTLETMTALVNSAATADTPDTLSDPDDVRRFIAERTITEVADPTPQDVAALAALRRELLSLVRAPEDARMTLVNRLLARASITPRLVEHDELGPHLHYFPPYAPLSEHLTADFAMAIAHLHAAGEGSRLLMCARPGCERVTLDTTRNRSRIYCDNPACANRVHAAAYRARQAKSRTGAAS